MGIEDSEAIGQTVMSCYATAVTLGGGYVIRAHRIMPGPFSSKPLFRFILYEAPYKLTCNLSCRNSR
jgi:hypothetical protein